MEYKTYKPYPWRIKKFAGSEWDCVRLPAGLDQRRVMQELLDAGVRSVLDESNEKIGYKIRLAQQEDRVPYMLVVGGKEAETCTVSVRTRSGEDLGAMTLDAFTGKVLEEIETRAK